MTNFTSNTYQMKREILSFSNKISRNLSKPERKFMADMIYGMLASGSCFLTDIVDRLSKHLAMGTPKDALMAYLVQVKNGVPIKLSSISMTVMSQNLTAISSNPLAGYVTVQKVLL